MNSKNQNKNTDIALFYKVGLGIIVLLILASCFSRQLNGGGWDFKAYYKAAGRILSGVTPYVYERDFSYKYAPVIGLPFTIFHLFSYDIARWVYAAFHSLLAISLPYLLYRIVKHDWAEHNSTQRLELKENFVMGVFISFLGTLRFLDSEFFVSQIGLWIIGGILLGIHILQRLPNNNLAKFIGLGFVSLASLIKMHTMLICLSFAKLKDAKGLLWIAGVFCFFALLPNPSYWLDWAAHMKKSTFDLPMNKSSVNLQGFYSFAVLKLGMNQFSLQPMLLALPLGILAFLKLERFTLSDIPKSASYILLNVSIWTLLGILASPLPWQYTYSILWVLVSLSWTLGNSIERKWIFAVSLFLGFSPQGIIGKSASYWLESHQSVFFAVLVFWFVMLFQSMRLKKEKLTPQN